MHHSYCAVLIEMFSYSSIAVFAAALLSGLPTIRPQDSVDIETVCSADDDIARFAVIREDLIAKLNPFMSVNITEESNLIYDSLSNVSREIDPALLTVYEAAARALRTESEEELSSCDRGRGTPSFAKRISLFFPASSGVTYMPSEILEENAYDSNGAKEEQKSSTLPFQYTFVFNLTLPSRPEVLYSAELRLFKKITSKYNFDMNFENVDVFYVSRKDGEERGRMLVVSKNVEIKEDEYEAFNITNAVEKWKADGFNESLELEVHINSPVSTKSGRFSYPSIEFAIDSTVFSVHETRAQLVIATIKEEVAAELEERQRKRRQAVDSQYCSSNPNVLHCCIRNLEVNFHTQLNLTWVLQPSTFTPNYCQGICPIPLLSDNLPRTKVQEFYNTNELGEGPCCTIYNMDSLLMMIRDLGTGEILIAYVPDMIITSCGCVN